VPTAPTQEPEAATLGKAAGSVKQAIAAYDGVATGAIVLVRVGERVRVLTLGLADVGRAQRMKPGDRFPIMSITKSMVATAVLQLVEEQKMALDDSVEDLLPGLLPQGRRITVEHLLSHRAGLHDPTDDDLPPPKDTTRDVWIDIAADHPLEFAPGSEGRYSNAGYEVLGRMVEKVTHEPLAVALAHRVFDPAGMSETALHGTPTVTGYYEGKEADDPYFRFVRASGGVVSTVRDIDRFYTALWGGELLEPDLVEIMTTSVGSVAPAALDYGLGIWLNREPCGDAMGHSGAGPGFNTKAWTLQDSDRSVVVMVNDGDGFSVANALATAALCP
jgi:D-alanyl-D-alanine carboxypeptidase